MSSGKRAQTGKTFSCWLFSGYAKIMKLKLNVSQKNHAVKSPEAKPKRGRKKVYGGVRKHFFPGEKLTAAIEKFRTDLKKQKVPVPTASTIYRSGSWMYMKKIYSDLAKATSGVYHAKDRRTKLVIG